MQTQQTREQEQDQEQVRSPSSGERRRGTKRAADDTSLNDDQRFTKRFNLLNLGGISNPNNSSSSNNSTYYIPVSPSLDAQHANRGTASAAATTTNGAHQHDAYMHLDDTPHRVYIHDLDAELADSASEDEKLIFLPDIEARLSRIPKHILHGNRGEEKEAYESQQLVLYDVPKSLTAEEGGESVRRAILESRQRARDKALQELEARREDMERKYQKGREEGMVETAHGYGGGYGDLHGEEEEEEEEEEDDDLDAMDCG